MSADDPVTVLSEDESWSLLSRVSVGRLVTIVGGQPEIFPVNSSPTPDGALPNCPGHQAVHRWDDRPGNFRGRRPHCRRGVERDRQGKGASLLSGNAEILDAEEAPLLSWPAASKPHYVRVISIGDHRPAFQVRVRFGSRIHNSLDDRLRWAALLALIPGAVFQSRGCSCRFPSLVCSTSSLRRGLDQRST